MDKVVMSYAFTFNCHESQCVTQSISSSLMTLLLLGLYDFKIQCIHTYIYIYIYIYSLSYHSTEPQHIYIYIYSQKKLKKKKGANQPC